MISNTEGCLAVLSARRAARGNITALTAVVAAVVILGIVVFALNYGRLLGSFGEHRTAVEAAGLAAAQDLARIVIDDPNYGFIALSDYPPIGKATVARDGSPLPVLSINTITATARLDLIMAREIGDPTMMALARQDALHAREARERLTNALLAAVDGSGGYSDMDGNRIDVPAHARSVYLQNMVRMANGAPVLKEFKLSLGWLHGGSSTVTPLPEPAAYAGVPDDLQQNGRYKAFVSIPAQGEDFTFAGASDRSALVDGKLFLPFDLSRACSVVKVYAQYTFDRDAHVLESLACAQPGAKEDTGPVGQLSLGFPDGPVPGINSVRDLFTDAQLNTNKMQPYESKNGDWPSPQDPGATLEPGAVPVGGSSPTVTQGFAMGFYDWLRSVRNRAHVDKINALLDTKFHTLDQAPQPQTTKVAWNFDLVQGAWARPGHKAVLGTPMFFVGGLPGGSSDPRYGQWGHQVADAGFWHMAGMENNLRRIPKDVFLARLLHQHGHSAVITSFTGSPNIKRSDVQKFWKGMADSANAAQKTLDAVGQAAPMIAQQLSTLRVQRQTAWQQNNSSLARSLDGQIFALDALMAGINNAKDNAQRIIAVTCDIRDRQTAYTAGGVAPLDYNNFNLSGRLLYFHPRAATVQELLGQGGNPAVPAPSGAAKDDQSWTWSWADTAGGTQKFYYYPYPVPNWPADPQPGPDRLADNAQAMRVIVDPDGTSKIAVQSDTPFDQVAVSENQPSLLSLNAMTTQADDLPVTWMAVVRDQCRNLGNARGGKHAGQPMPGNPLDFCQKAQFGGSPGERMGIIGGRVAYDGTILNSQPRSTYVCGGLAFEFQLRSPVVFNQGESASAGELPVIPLAQPDGTSTSGGIKTLTPKVPTQYF